jgi:hypothetical protein
MKPLSVYLCSLLVVLFLGAAGCVTTEQLGGGGTSPGEDSTSDDDDSQSGSDDDDSQSNSDDDDSQSNSDDDDSQSGPNDDDSDGGNQEVDCEDGLDDDGDSLIDCDDPDCEDVFHCTWPDSVSIETQVIFYPNDIADSFGVGQCTLQLSGILAETDLSTPCTSCDRDFEGAVTAAGDCPPDYIDVPQESRFGIQFLSPTERELFKWDHEASDWEALGSVQSSGSVWEVVRNEPVFYEVPIFGETEVGSFTITEKLTDL